MFGKRIADLTRADIDRVVAEEVPEGAEVEFKATLPSRKGSDPWCLGKMEIGEYGRNALLAEIVAFANAYGGIMVVGIEETDDKPARAAKIAPIRDCVELADRLRLQCRDCIEPQIPLLEVVGVPMRDDGAGVVVVAVPRSRVAPHRSKPSLECYARRADRTEKMTMREIQDLTLQVERGIAAVNSRFHERREAFENLLQGRAPALRQTVGLRTTAIPLSPLNLSRIHRMERMRLHLPQFTATIGSGEPFTVAFPFKLNEWRPILRGTNGRGGNHHHSFEYYGLEDGELGFQIRLDRAMDDRQPLILYAGWMVALFANTLLSVELMRTAAGAGEVEYGLEIEVVNVGTKVPIGVYGKGFLGETHGAFAQGTSVFPRYSIGPREEFAKLTAEFETDFWHITGYDEKEQIRVDYNEAIELLGLN